MKILGIVFVLLGCTMIGFRFSFMLNERINQLKTLRKLIVMLRGEINYNHSTLVEALEIISKRTSKPFSDFTFEISQQLKKMTGQSVDKLWETMTDKHLAGTSLTKKDLMSLKSLGENMGYLDKEMQLASIDLYNTQMEENIEEAMQKCNANGKLYKMLGVMAGIFITIIIV